MSRTPIADYALLSDCHSAALVSRSGSVDWFCVPRFDSPSTFGRLLDDAAGHWSIRPVGEARVERRYAGPSLVLETTFHALSGTAVLTDLLAVGRNERGHELGMESPRALLRLVRCSSGSIELELEYVPRPEYGLVFPRLSKVPGGLVGRGGAEVLLLSSPVPLSGDGSAGHGRFRLEENQSAGFALQQRRPGEAPPQPWTQSDIARRLDDTAEAWRTWSALHQSYNGPWAELVQLSGRVLQGLTYCPTSAIVAAPTTSLPESPGGLRNWDYRFTWVRDASLTLEALWVAACPDEAYRFFDFLARVALGQFRRGADLQIMFGVGGERDLSERVLPHLKGWRASAPVRIGNGAWTQRQLDVYGELLGAVERLREQVTDIDPSTAGFLIEVAEAAAARWKERDQGLWEVRGEPRHYVHSKLMCWVALARAISLAPLFGAQGRVERWRATQEEIRQAILERGWSDRAGAFAQCFDDEVLDASSLMMPIVGFLPPRDPRMLATIEAISARLTDRHGLVYRYRGPDGLAGEEGTFLLCTFWLAQCWAMAGEVERAREVFARAVSFVNDVGLLAEEVEPQTGQLLGNFPQAFSHIGLVNAAWAITLAEERRREKSGSSSELSGGCGLGDN